MGRSGIAIVVFDKSCQQTTVLNLYTGETKIVEPWDEIPREFIMKMSDVIAEDFLQAFAEALDAEGIKTDKDAKIQGTLEAQKYHLEDLRRLLKLNK